MPHLIVEYTDNLADEIELDRLFVQAHEILKESGVFPLAGIRSRGIELKHYRMADGAADYAFVHVTLKIGHGRDIATRRQVGEALFGLFKAHLAPLFERRPLALSFELTELHAELNFKHNNVHRMLETAHESSAHTPKPT